MFPNSNGALETSKLQKVINKFDHEQREAN